MSPTESRYNSTTAPCNFVISPLAALNIHSGVHLVMALTESPRPLPKNAVTINASRFRVTAANVFIAFLNRSKNLGCQRRLWPSVKAHSTVFFVITVKSKFSCLTLRTPRSFCGDGYANEDSSVASSKDDFVAATVAGAIGVGPSVHHFCCTPDKPLGCPFILEDFVPGSSLHSILPSLTDGQRFAVAEKLVQLWRLYSQISFIAPGKLQAAPGVPDEWSHPQHFSIEDAMLLVTVQPLKNDRGPTGVTQLLSLEEQLQDQFELLKIDMQARSLYELYKDDIEMLGKALKDLRLLGMFDPSPLRLCHPDLFPQNIMVHCSDDDVGIKFIDWDNLLIVPSPLAQLPLLGIMLDYQSKTGDAAASDVSKFVPVLNGLELSSLQREYLSLLDMGDHPAQLIDIMTVELFVPLIAILLHPPTTTSDMDYLDSFSARWTVHSESLPHNTDTFAPTFAPAVETWRTLNENL